jgi:tetratricopeptide (TPR) repeat protein
VERAERAFLTAAEVEPDSIHAHVALGRLFVAKRDLVRAEQELKMASDLAPKNSMIQIQFVDFYRLIGKNEEAKKLVRDLTVEVPDFLPAWHKLAEMEFSEGNYDETARALIIYLEKRPNDPEALELLGQVHDSKGERPQAIEKYREAVAIQQIIIKQRPNLASAHLRLAQLHLRLGEFTQAETELEEVTKLSPSSTEARLLLAELHLRTGKLDSAIQNLTDFVEERQNARAYSLLGNAYFRKNDMSRALEAYQDSVRLFPNNHEVRHNLGLTFRATGKFLEAQKQFEAALALSPGYVESLAQLVAIAMATRQGPQAVERIKQQIELVPSSGAHHHLLGNTYLAIGEMDEAIHAFLAAIRLEPQMTSPYIQLAAIYARSGRLNDAFAKMNEAIAQNPEDLQSLVILGMLHEQKGDFQSAAKAYEKILEIQPNFAIAANNLAYISAEQDGDLDRALQLAEAAVAADPNNPLIADTLGWVLFRRGTHERALSILKECATKAPNNPEIQYHLGMTYYKLNNYEAAWLALNRALELRADFPGADEARSVLAALDKLQ